MGYLWNVLLFIFCFCFWFATVTTNDLVWPCITPNSDEGFCMPFKNCSKLLNQLENLHAKPFLRASKCGPKTKHEDETNPLVCCGKHSNYLVLAKKTSKLKQRGKHPKPECGYQNFTIINSRILGGNEATLGEFPWMVTLYHNNKTGEKKFGCAGSLISQIFVLTAAHCLESSDHQIYGPIFEVHLGEHNIKNHTGVGKVQIIKVSKMYVHPSFDPASPDYHNDIGLIFLKRKAKICTYVFPICLMERQVVNPTEYWVSGWGATNESVLTTSSSKLKLSLHLFNHSKCTKMYDRRKNLKIVDTQICAGGEKNKDTCRGDSGGPLMVADGNRWFVAGLVSYGVGCGRKGWPGIYTNVTSYFNWIKSTMAQARTIKNKKKKKKI